MTDPDIRIIRQNRRSMMMRVVPGAVEVFIPTRYQSGDRCVVQFIRKNLPKVQPHLLPAPPELITQAQIMAMMQDYAARLGVQPARVAFRDMRRKWGSCSAQGTITLNTRLSWLEAPLAEYIVAHELAHLHELNHSQAFWAVLASVMPDYKARIHALRAAERALWSRE